MKKSWVLFFLLIIVVSTSGCSNISNSNNSNSINLNYNEIANAKFCFFQSSVSFDPPLIHVGTFIRGSSFEMPIEPGKYKIILTTSKPESAVRLEISYNEFIKKDKFGIPLFEFRKNQIGTSNRYADLNSEIIIPDGSIDGKINIYESYESRGDNCGTIIVARAI